MQPTYEQLAKDLGFELPKRFLSIEDYLKPYDILSRLFVWQAIHANNRGQKGEVTKLKENFLAIQARAFDSILESKNNY